jgi:LCP family protein required for cell wall assembly
VVIAMVLGTAVAWGAVEYHKLDGHIQTFSEAGVSKHRPPPSYAGQNILLIGSDTRTGDNAKLGGKGDAVGRSDTTLLVHIYADNQHAVAVSIPRDALVTIPSCRLPDGSWSSPQYGAMFNEAFSMGQAPRGNPACTQNTVEQLTGMRVDHTIVANFAGFAALTKVVGGVRVCLPHALYQGDLNPNLHEQGKLVFKAGIQRVSGAKALDYVRIRHGIGDGSDIGRIRRQQAFLASVVRKVRAEGLTPTHLLPLAEAATKYFTVDPGLGSPAKLLSFAMSLRQIQTKDITFVTTPWRYDGARVALVHPAVDRLWAALKADQPLTKSQTAEAGQTKHSSSSSATSTPTLQDQVKAIPTPVSVLNGTLVSNLAGHTSRHLHRMGLSIASVANAATADYQHTVVEYGPGQQADATVLQSLFTGATLQQTQKSGLSIILGQQHEFSPEATGPVKIPKSVIGNSRNASTNICSDISYGADAYTNASG